MVRIYLLHGTNYRGFTGIGDGDPDRGGYVGGGSQGWDEAGWFKLSTTGDHSWLGRGVYATTSYNKARFYGDYLYLLEFDVARIKMVDRWDQKNKWRNDDVDGVYCGSKNDL